MMDYWAIGKSNLEIVNEIKASFEGRADIDIHHLGEISGLGMELIRIRVFVAPDWRTQDVLADRNVSQYERLSQQLEEKLWKCIYAMSENPGDVP
jgi:hypothetical protein